MDSRTVSNFDVTPEENIRQLVRVTLNASGGDPSHLLELLADVIEMNVWQNSGMTFSRFVNTPYDKGGLGWSIKDLKAVLSLTHRYEAPNPVNRTISDRLNAMRTEVNRLLADDIEPTNPHGGDRRSNQIDVSSRSGQGGNSRAYIISRLKRDRPDLAEKVINNEMKTSEAKRLAGYPVDDRIKIPIDNPQRAAEMIIDKMPHAAIAELLAILKENLHGT